MELIPLSAFNGYWPFVSFKWIVSWTKRHGRYSRSQFLIPSFPDYMKHQYLFVRNSYCPSLTHYQWTRFLKQSLVLESIDFNLQPYRFSWCAAYSPSVLTTVTNVPIKPVCFPAIERTWILDLTQSTGYTAIHRQLPPKPPLSSKGMGPKVKK